MKKVLFIAVVAVASLASCKKDRTCTCTTTSSGVTTTEVTVIHEAKKGDARQMCYGTQTTTTVSGGGASGTSVGDDTTCELK